MNRSKFIVAISVSLALAFIVSCGLTGEVGSDSPKDGGSSSSANNSGGSSHGNSSSGGAVSGNTFIDERDGKIYKWVKIGEQIWMAENLNFHGDDGFLGLCYDDNPNFNIRKLENCNKYGKLYDWETAMAGESSSDSDPSGVQGVCPQGWHLPSYAEWITLTDYVEAQGNCTDCAVTKLRATSDWFDEDEFYIPGTDNYGFSALPGGQFNTFNFNDVGYKGYWWSSTDVGPKFVMGLVTARVPGMMYSSEGVEWLGHNKRVSLSVRCVKD